MGTNLPGPPQGSGSLVPYEARGERSAIRELYRKYPTGNWERLDRDRVTVSDVDFSGDAYAIVARYEAGTSPDHLASFTVHSPYIINLLKRVFHGYPGLYTSLKEIEFSKPFEPFYHRWQVFVDAAEQETGDIKAFCHIKLLQDLVGDVIRPVKAKVDDLLANGLMDDKHLWVLFPPHTEIYAHSGRHARLYQVAKISHWLPGEPFLECEYIDCDGSKFNHVGQTFQLPHYKGLKPIQELGYIPISMHQDKGVREILSTRGRKFEGLNGIYYRSFSGVAQVLDSGTSAYREVPMHNTRVIIDPARFSEAQKIRTSRMSDSNVKENMLRRAKEAHQAGGTSTVDTSLEEPMKKLTENEYALCAPTIKGFSMTHKAWAIFPVDGVGEIAWSDTALERLVLHDDYKKIILAFVQAQLSKADDFDDVIQGKGQGIIMLFQGPAGVGKTLTAESVAEEMKCPLYTMSSGELGDNAAEVEGRLRTILQLCAHWKAVLLLDECDVFLEKRSSANMSQNKLVAVFLRLLEYYQGCLILTSNRVQDIDPAFESRIHLTIEYPELDADSRYQIWWNFLHGSEHAQAKSSSIREPHVRDLAKRELNGRQIKNIIKTSRLLAARDGVALNIEHIRTVLRVSGPGLLDRKGG
ncbi:hypothetical protein SLS62_005003 [Diatrype stigma]|uniref:AAA+ ATPase domain-containing protein n=1 Tax=Diatrype stigma TaxID=117547 RepID=A0AAN9V3Y7_9PEZI